MHKIIVVLVLLIFSSSAFSAEGVDNAAYIKDVIGVFFNFFLIIARILGFIGLGMLSVNLIKHVCNPTLAQSEGVKPATFFRYLGGVVAVTFLFQPLQHMVIFNDLTGLVNASKGMDMCLVVDVTASNYSWGGAASECVERVEGRLGELAEYTNKDHIKSANLGLFFAACQLLGLAFFVVKGWGLVQHSLGKRDLKSTVFGLIISMIFASALMALPNITEYISDLSEDGSGIIKT